MIQSQIATVPTIIETISAVLNAPLPGAEGQLWMAPQAPEGGPSRQKCPDGCREAGVLLLLYPHHNAELHVALMRRPEYPGVHSGQISLPGGRREENETLQQTALREAHEEVGIRPETLAIIGQLSPLYTPPSDFCIYPLVAYSSRRPDFRLDEREVAELIEVPMSYLRDEANHKVEMWHFQKFGTRRIPFFDVQGRKVWGATAMILGEFITLLEQA